MSVNSIRSCLGKTYCYSPPDFTFTFAFTFTEWKCFYIYLESYSYPDIFTQGSKLTFWVHSKSTKQITSGKNNFDVKESLTLTCVLDADIVDVVIFVAVLTFFYDF